MSHEEHLLKVLENIANEQHFNDYQFLTKEISSGGANYTSKLFTVTVKEASKNDLYLFAKVACVGDQFRASMDYAKIFATEHFVYKELAHIYSKLEHECSVPEENKLVLPKYYGSDLTPCKETLVLEDLAAKGWLAYDRFQCIDWAYATAAVNELVKMHSLAFAYREKNPEEFKRDIDNTRFKYEGPVMDHIEESSLATAFKHMKSDYQEALRNHFKEYNLETAKFVGSTSHTAIIHGDYRPSNLMHKVNEDGTVDIKIVDLQTMQGNSPVIDLIYFIFTGSDEKFREQYYEKLLDHYYTQLSAAMVRLHLDPEKVYSRADFEFELKEKLPYGLTIAVFALPIVTVDTENAPKVDEDMELTAFSVDCTSQLYTERLNGVVNDYVKWGILK